MENKKAIKNMDYWRKKNNIPGIDTAHEAGLTGDGRAGSAPFQMAKTGSSPNKGFLQNLGQGLIGKGSMGFLNPAMWAARGAKNLLDNDPTTGTIFGGGGGNPNAMAAMQNQMVNPNVQVNPMATLNQGPLGMKSPMKQENEEKLIAGQYLKAGEEPGTYIDKEEGEGYTDPDGYVEIDDEGNVVDNDYQYIVNEENVIIGVKQPETAQMGVGEMMGGIA